MALQPKANLERAIRSRVARMAVSSSTVRGRPAGTIESARRFLRSLPLRPFAEGDGAVFQRALDRTTTRLRKALPMGAQQWGLARKILNIYLRDCAYSAHLRSAYCVGRIESFLELPLDSVTAGRLRQSEEGTALPRWPGVGGITAEAHAQYQRVAAQVARARSIKRVHLDVFWWSEERDA